MIPLLLAMIILNASGIVLAIWFILYAVGALGAYAIPSPVMGVIAIVAAILLLIGR